MRKFIKTFSKIVSFLWILLIFIPIAIIYTLFKQVPSRFYKELNLIDYETPLTRDYFKIESVLEMETYDKDSRVKVYKTSSIYDTFNHRFVKSIAVDENENVAVLQEHYPGIAGVSIFDRDWNFICGYTIIWWEGEYIEWNSECLNIVKSNNRFVSIDIDNDTFNLGHPVNESFYPYARNEYSFKGGTLKLANKDDEKRDQNPNVHYPAKFDLLIQIDAEGNQTEIINAVAFKQTYNTVSAIGVLSFVIAVLLSLPYILIRDE